MTWWRRLRFLVRTRLAPAVAGVLGVLLAAGAAEAQGLAVQPVNILLAPGQMATTLTVTNQGGSGVSFQVRVYAWSQGDDDRLDATEDLLASPPLASIPAGGTQVVRLLLRRPPEGHEATYRILLDQIPPAAPAGTVQVALRLSLPVFAEPAGRIGAHLQWRLEQQGGQLYVVAVNDGTRHETVRGITLVSGAGSVEAATNASPYVLAGATRRWRMAGRLPAGPGASFRLTARADGGAIDIPVAAAAAR